MAITGGRWPSTTGMPRSRLPSWRCFTTSRSYYEMRSIGSSPRYLPIDHFRSALPMHGSAIPASSRMRVANGSTRRFNASSSSRRSRPAAASWPRSRSDSGALFSAAAMRSFGAHASTVPSQWEWPQGPGQPSGHPDPSLPESHRPSRGDLLVGPRQAVRPPTGACPADRRGRQALHPRPVSDRQAPPTEALSPGPALAGV